MAALFPVWSNTLIRAALVLGASSVVGGPSLLMLWVRTPLHNDQLEPRDQPVEFDHRHHVNDDGIDCRYCHYPVERSAFAGVPPTSLCMNCHSQIWNTTTLLEPVRQSFFNNTPIEWRRVYWLPDFVYFNHAVHVNRGVGCETCHGQVNQMGRVYKVTPLTMSWCLDCHRNPEQYLRPLDHITDMGWRPDRPQIEVGLEVKRALGVDPPTSCSTCHR